MSVNIVSVITDGVVLFVTSPVFWLAVVGWLVILTPVICRRKFSAEKRLTKIMNNFGSIWISGISRNIAPGSHRLPCGTGSTPDGPRP